MAINLRERLLKDVNNKLNQLGFEKGGVVYLNAHDTEEKTMFVNE
ncbi:MAG: hypothetical protein R2784_20185 [Saprospiraceae bacterium]